MGTRWCSAIAVAIGLLVPACTQASDAGRAGTDPSTSTSTSPDLGTADAGASAEASDVDPGIEEESTTTSPVDDLNLPVSAFLEPPDFGLPAAEPITDGDIQSDDFYAMRRVTIDDPGENAELMLRPDGSNTMFEPGQRGCFDPPSPIADVNYVVGITEGDLLVTQGVKRFANADEAAYAVDIQAMQRPPKPGAPDWCQPIGDSVECDVGDECTIAGGVAFFSHKRYLITVLVYRGTEMSDEELEAYASMAFEKLAAVV